MGSPVRFPPGGHGDAGDRETAALLQDLLRQAPTAAAVLDRQLRYQVVSQTWADVLGRPPEALTHQPFSEATTPFASVLLPLLREALAGGGPREGIPLVGAALASLARLLARHVRYAAVSVYPLATGCDGPDGVGLLLHLDPVEPEQPARDLESLQRNLLPSLAPIPGLEVSSRYLPASLGAELGGDWYDLISLPRGAVGLVIGDVVGHDLVAAAGMAQTRAALRAYASEGYGPLAVLRKVDAFVNTSTQASFATLFFARLRLPGFAAAEMVDSGPTPTTGLLRYANAGHPPPLLLNQDGRASYLTDALNPPVGFALADATAEEALRWPPGSTLLLYTDGLIERRTSGLQEGLDRLQEVASSCAQLAPDQLCDAVIADMLGDEPREDDVALLAVRLPADG